MPCQRSLLLAAVPVLVAGSVPGCQAVPGTGETGPSGRDGQPEDVLQVYGSLRRMMHEGRTGVEVNLDSLLPDGRLQAVGALEGLRGEITIVNGQVWLAYPGGAPGEDGTGTDRIRMVSARTSGEGAALLVAARVEDWREGRLEVAAPPEDLDRRLAELAVAAGLPAGQPFVFLIEGEVEDLRWHVIDGRRLHPGANGHESHRKAAVTGEADAARTTLVGFYSEDHQGVFTHAGERTHIHAVVEDGDSSGHVDGVKLRAGTLVRMAGVVQP